MSQAVIHAQPMMRQPLKTIRLPVKQAAKCNYLPEAYVWWIERKGTTFHLRAKVKPEAAMLEQELLSDQRIVTWQLDPKASERISWSGTNDARCPSHLVGNISENGNSLSILPISKNVEAQLEKLRLSVSENMMTFEYATKFVMSVIERTKSEIPPINLSFLSNNVALNIVRSYYARCELPYIYGYDSYEVAAKVLTGQEFFFNPNATTAENSSYNQDNIANFKELEPSSIIFPKKIWKDIDEKQSIEINSLSIKSMRHQFILRQLTEQLIDLGYKPQHNQYIDLNINRDIQIFFEVKTANNSNFLKQVRTAIGQLFEYRFRYKRLKGDVPINLVVVIEKIDIQSKTQFARDLLQELGIALVVWREETSTFEDIQSALS